MSADAPNVAALVALGFLGVAVFLGLGILALVLSIKGLASDDDPDIRAKAGDRFGPQNAG